ncbi:MAG TPA: hypothetical protein VG939_05770 [Caulobacteraceae bacterium]|nr:hypothetical protein [Caulobacteraceae bacterium]
MAVQLSTAVRNARLDQVETTIGAAPLLRIHTGAMPADCAAAASGTKLVEITLPSDWMAGASGGSKSKSGTWSAAAVATSTGGYWRIYDASGSTCHLQGTVTATGGGGDMTLDNTSITSGQTVTVTTFTLTDANA